MQHGRSTEFSGRSLGTGAGFACQGTLRFRNTRAGALRVRLYDTRGRGVRLLLDDPFAPAGVHAVVIPVDDARRRLASSVYFYRIEAAEGRATGRVPVLR